uniref:Uncharacterized protein n=1 Tax=Arundo donax TaxID=35708 RepID=A0A0A9GQC5_ARUDO
MLDLVFHHRLARSRLLEHLLPQFFPLRLRLLPLFPLCLNYRLSLFLRLLILRTFLLILFFQALCSAFLPLIMCFLCILCIITSILTGFKLWRTV